jgi:4-hydroxybenzoate polyprenyltransferase
MTAQGRHRITRRLTVPRAGEIVPNIEFAKEACSKAELLAFDRNENAALLSAHSITDDKVIAINDFKSHARVSRELPSDVVTEKDVECLPADSQRGGFLQADRGNTDARHVLVDAKPEVLSQPEQVDIPIDAEFLKPRAMVLYWCQAFRVHHWIKNMLLFVPLVFDHSHAGLSTWLETFAGFLLLSFCVSGTYIINDISDLDADRVHPQKQHRPFAAGRLNIASGILVAGTLILSSLAGAVFLSTAFTALLLLYLTLTFAYSFKLKQLPLLDVTTLAGLHTLRLGMGIVLSSALLPGSLVFAASLSFLSLALAKRHSEMVNTGIKYSAISSGRGYFTTDANITLAVGVGSALVATQVTVFYLLETLPAEMLTRTTLLWPIPVLLCIWLIRIWLFANRGQLNEDLAMFALRDTFTAAVIVCMAGSVLVAA